jgi:hypothetical protein
MEERPRKETSRTEPGFWTARARHAVRKSAKGGVRATLYALMLLLAPLFSLLAFALQGSAPAPDKPFWRAIVAAQYAPPAGADVPALALELARTAGSTDPELRDELGFEICARWVRRPGILSDEDVRKLLRLHLSNIHKGLGEGESDGVFLRSFSALHLSQIVSRDLKQPFLTQVERSELVQASCRAVNEERDRRGWVEGRGWAHPIAHNADLLARLAQEPGLPAEEQRALLAALGAGLAGTNAFGENDRLAAVLGSLVSRADFVEADFERWLGEASKAANAVWQSKPFDVAAFHKAENTKAMLRAVLLAVLLDKQPGEGERKAGEAIRAAFFAQGS